MEETTLTTDILEKEIEEKLDRCWRSLAAGQKNGMQKQEWMQLMDYAQCLLGLHESIKSARYAGLGINDIFEKYDPKEE